MHRITRIRVKNYLSHLNRPFWTSRAVHTDASNIRNIALMAHIGMSCISSTGIGTNKHFICRLWQNHFDRVHFACLRIRRLSWLGRFWEYHNGFSPCRKRKRNYNSVCKHPCSLEAMDLQSYRHTRARRFWHGGRKCQSCGRRCRGTS